MKGYIELNKKDIDDGKRLDAMFAVLSPEAKLQAEAYMSALRDKEILEQAKMQKKELMEA